MLNRPKVTHLVPTRYRRLSWLAAFAAIALVATFVSLFTRGHAVPAPGTNVIYPLYLVWNAPSLIYLFLAAINMVLIAVMTLLIMRRQQPAPTPIAASASLAILLLCLVTPVMSIFGLSEAQHKATLQVGMRGYQAVTHVWWADGGDVYVVRTIAFECDASGLNCTVMHNWRETWPGLADDEPLTFRLDEETGVVYLDVGAESRQVSR